MSNTNETEYAVNECTEPSRDAAAVQSTIRTFLSKYTGEDPNDVLGAVRKRAMIDFNRSCYEHENSTFIVGITVTKDGHPAYTIHTAGPDGECIYPLK
jgi:hypothetical protein